MSDSMLMLLAGVLLLATVLTPLVKLWRLKRRQRAARAVREFQARWITMILGPRQSHPIVVEPWPSRPGQVSRGMSLTPCSPRVVGRKPSGMRLPESPGVKAAGDRGLRTEAREEFFSLMDDSGLTTLERTTVSGQIRTSIHELRGPSTSTTSPEDRRPGASGNAGHDGDGICCGAAKFLCTLGYGHVCGPDLGGEG